VKIITIDGPASSGKSTLARTLAESLGWVYVNTGSLYRTLALLFIEAQEDSDTHALERFIGFLTNRYRQDSLSGRVFLGEREITKDIRSPHVSHRTSHISQNPHVREKLLPIQRKVVLECQKAVVDGRDMGTVVFPEAPLKIFLTASFEERAKRRAAELHKHGHLVDVASLAQEIHERDERDAQRDIAPMRPAEDALIIDSTQHTPKDLADQVLNIARARHLTEHVADHV